MYSSLILLNTIDLLVLNFDKKIYKMNFKIINYQLKVFK